VRIKAVITDFGGVLVRTLDQSGRKKWEKQLGLSEGGLSQAVFNSQVAVNASLGAQPEKAVWEYVANTFNLSIEQMTQLQDDFWIGDHLDRELVDYFSALRPRFRTAILSNAWDGARDLFTGKFGLASSFDKIIISAEEKLAKPDPKIYKLAADRLGVKPHETVFVDDFLVNVVGAREVGMKSIQYSSTPQIIQELDSLLTNP
jgi:epoxide hydrolase-like predicted phosphatase